MTEDVNVSDCLRYTEHATPLPTAMTSTLWIHRIGVAAGKNAEQISQFFLNGRGSLFTGGHMAYHYIVGEDIVEQALPLDEQGAHARRWGNAHGIGIAVIGDFRIEPPTPSQWHRTAALCSDLLPLLAPHTDAMSVVLGVKLRFGIPVIGHGEVRLSYSQRYADKAQPDGPSACPGRHWDMNEFRAEVERELARRAVLRCAKLGHRLRR